jgi:hypothetical protein
MHTTGSGRDRLLALVDTADQTRILHSTNEDALEKGDRAWRRWNEFLASIDITDNTFLSGYAPPRRTFIATAFAQALRQGDFARAYRTKSNNTTTFCARTVQASVSRVAAEFGRHGQPSPFHQHNLPHLFHHTIYSLFRAWQKLDPPPRRQETINPNHLLYIHHSASNSGKIVLQWQSELLIAAFFFACRSCEYSSVRNRGRTKLLCVRNIPFFVGDHRIDSSSSFDATPFADSVSVTFEDQKNGEKMDIRRQHRTNHNVLCPVKAF